jgi:hypothetical protein
MTERNLGGPAFPTTKPLDSWGDSNQGMTLRDYFAAAFVSSGHVFKSAVPVNIPELVAAQAYQLADAMLEARK